MNKSVINKESNNNFKEINITNSTCCYFNAMIKFEDFDFDNISLDEKLYRNTLIFEIFYKTLTGAKLLRIRFDKVDRFITVYKGTRYLESFGGEKYNRITTGLDILKE